MEGFNSNAGQPSHPSFDLLADTIGHYVLRGLKIQSMKLKVIGAEWHQVKSSTICW